MTGPRIVTLDIERVPGVAHVKHWGRTIEGDFWDLNGWKDLIRRRISFEEVQEWPRTICLAWRQLGKTKVEFAAEWQEDGYEGMLRRAWDAYDKADIIVGHNVRAFDTKHLNTGWRDLGLGQPSPFKTVDTLTQARAVFGDESKQLVALTSRLGIPTKTDKYDVKTARAAVAGDVKAQRKLAAYNKGDIIASEELYLATRTWMKSHPNMGLYMDGDVKRCGRCGNAELQRRGFAYTDESKFQQYACVGDKGCGAWMRGKQAIARTEVRSVVR